MRVEPLGESALILRELPASAPAVAELLAGVEGVVEAWAAFDTVGVVFRGEVSEEALLAALDRPMPANEGGSHVVPVLYDGEDLAELVCRAGVTEDEFVALHARQYDCRAVGFCPGFAYLGPLDPVIDLPRRDSPRPRVAAGSVATAAGMTAAYPLERPGGWWIVGRTPLTLVDEADGYFPIRAGDRVRFVEIDAAEFERRRGERL